MLLKTPTDDEVIYVALSHQEQVLLFHAITNLQAYDPLGTYQPLWSLWNELGTALSPSACVH